MWSQIDANLSINTKVILPHPRRKDRNGYEIFLSFSAEKITQLLDKVLKPPYFLLAIRQWE